jgi:Zn-dependent protease
VSAVPAAEDRACPSCGTEVRATRLVCPACQGLVHASELRRLAEEAERATREGRRADAVTAWRAALELLPPEAVQSKTIGERLAALTEGGEPAAAPSPAATSVGRKGVVTGVVVGLLVLLSKFKFLVVFALTKIKWLFAGLTKGGTFVSMALTLGVYWAAWGWRFALGLLVSLYIHEMGHVAALERLGIKATGPMFIPGLGAFVRLKQYPATPREDARVGLAGPIWGMGVAALCFALWQVTGYGLWGALAEWGGRINLFNLTPLGPLDGGRGFRALSRGGRWTMVALSGAALLVSGEPVLFLVLGVGILNALGPAPEQSDPHAFAWFAILITVLAALTAAPQRIAGPLA